METSNPSRLSSAPVTEPSEPKIKVGSIVQALSIIRHLGSTGGGQGVTAIAAALGISPSSCFNILKTLTAERIIDFDKARKTYCLGLGLVELVQGVAARPNLQDTIAPYMQALADRYDVVVGLWRMAGDRPILIGLAETDATTRIHLTIGQQLPVLAGAVGRCVAAHRRLSASAIRPLLRQVPWQQEISVEDYSADLERARALGYAIDADCFIRGVTTVAAPVLDNGEMRYCISATAFSAQLSPPQLDAVGKSVRELAARALDSAHHVKPK